MRNGLVEGVSLRAVLRESGAMAPEAAASVLAGMLVTLAVVHGDVRPEHVQVDGSGGLALTDFGGTDAQFVPNTATYLAPERLQGAPADASGDVFSATAVFFECLTTEAPFVASTREDLVALYEYAEIIAEFAPPELRPLTQHGLTADAARRPSSPHAFLDEVASTATEVYGPDWQERGRALLSEWAVAAARAEGVELAAPFGVGETAVVASGAVEEAPPVGEPIEELPPPFGEPIDEGLPVGEPIEEAPPVGEPIEELPPPFGEPIDEGLLGADEVAADEPADVAAPAEPAEVQAEDDRDYDWFSGSRKTAPETSAEPLGAEADVLAAFDGARSVREAEATSDAYTPTGFDVFADRSAPPAPAEDPEPVTGHWDEPEPVEGEPAPEAAEPTLGEPDAEAVEAETAEAEALAAEATAAEALPAEAEPAPEVAEAAELSEAEAEAEPEADLDAEDDFEPLIEDSSELLAAFDAFTAPKLASDPEPLPKRDPFAGLALEGLAASTLAAASAAPEAAADSEVDPAASEPESDSVEPESESGSTEPYAESTIEPEAGSATSEPTIEPETGSATAEPTSEPETEAAPAEPQAEAPVAEPEPEAEAEAPSPDPEPEATALDSASEPEAPDTPADLEDDWVFPTKPSPKVPRSLSAFAVSLPSLPRPAEAEEPKPPVQTSAPDDWFRPGVAEPPTGEDAHNTQVLNPDRDNTIESAATRTFDEVPAELAAGSDAYDDGDGDELDRDASTAGGGSGGPRRKTLVGAVTTAVLLVAGATAVVLSGSGKSPAQGTGTTPTETASSSTPSPTGLPSTPVGTSTDSGDTTSSSSTPSYHHSSTHSRSRSSSASTSHSSSDGTPTRSSSSETPTTHSSSSTTPTSTATSPTSSCSTGILGLPDCGPSTTPTPKTSTTTGH